MKRTFTTALFAFLLVATSAHAGDARPAANAFGLIGAWAKVDCQQPASAANIREIWAVDADGAVTEVIGGPGYETRYRFDQAAPVGDDQLALDGVYLGNGHGLHLVLEKQGGKLRTYASQDTTVGQVLVAAGLKSANGQPTSWLAKCAP